jgi:hypothetical protein
MEPLKSFTTGAGPQKDQTHDHRFPVLDDERTQIEIGTGYGGSTHL